MGCDPALFLSPYSMLSDEYIKSLRDDPKFIFLKEYLFKMIDRLNSLDGLQGLSNKRAGEEAKARIKAAAKLKEILEPFVNFREKREITESEINLRKARFGL